jgi:hypothetical protein
MLGSGDSGTPDASRPDVGTPPDPTADASSRPDTISHADVTSGPDASAEIDSSHADGPPPLYEPCRDKRCGDPCTLCDPVAASSSCVEGQTVRHCTVAGSCTDSAVVCDGICPPCVPDIAWGPDGGFVAYVDQSAITSCTTYTHARVSGSNTLLSCSQPIDNTTCVTGAITAVLGDSDMVAALAASPVLYGADPRPVDGQVFRLTVDGKTIDVGGDCPAGASTCRPIPPGVKAAVDFFQSLERAQMTQRSCKSTFPDWCISHCPGSGSPPNVCGADGVTYSDSTVAACCGVTVAHDGPCGDYAVTDLATNALRKAISKSDTSRGFCFRIVLAYLSGPNIGITAPTGWISESAWFSSNLADCNSVGGPLPPAATEVARRGAGVVTMTGGGGGGSPCRFSVHATLDFANVSSEAFVADNLDAGFCP